MVESITDIPSVKNHVIHKTQLTMTSDNLIVLSGSAKSGTTAEMIFEIDAIRVIAKRLLALCDIAEGAADDSPG